MLSQYMSLQTSEFIYKSRLYSERQYQKLLQQSYALKIAFMIYEQIYISIDQNLSKQMSFHSIVNQVSQLLQWDPYKFSLENIKVNYSFSFLSTAHTFYSRSCAQKSIMNNINDIQNDFENFQSLQKFCWKGVLCSK
ncbi:hypothetical protein pb186bvf_002431 [Paramecium bursaria]